MKIARNYLPLKLQILIRRNGGMVDTRDLIKLSALLEMAEVESP